MPVGQAASASRHFRCTVELRSIRNFTTGPTTSRIFLRYNYPFFGTSAPEFTKPLDIGRNSERLFEGATAKFSFIASWNELRTEFAAQPLEVEVHSTDAYAKSEMIGKVRVDLTELLVGAGEPFAPSPFAP
jgi:centrosomal protein CEP120